MFIDWYIWLTPLILLPIVGLLVFVGCHILLPFQAGNPNPQPNPNPEYPDIQLNAGSVYDGASFSVIWTFNNQAGQLVGTITRGPTNFAAPNAFPVTVKKSDNNNELGNITKNKPVSVKCDCTITPTASPFFPNPLPFKVSDWSVVKTYPYQPTTNTTTMVWKLNHVGTPQKKSFIWTCEEV